METKTIAGHEITLKAGGWYWASRPGADGRKVFDVTIASLASDDDTEVVIRGLNYDQANELINAFNNGWSSFDGRVW